MPEIKPFRALRYNAKRVSLSDVVAPPYDVISPDQQAALYRRSPHNVVRLILGREEDRYEEARMNLEQWTEEHVLLRDEDPAVYFLEQEFTGPDGTSHRRRGFIAICRVEEFKAGAVLPHERTLSKPKEDRFRLVQATRTNLSQIFSIYSDPEHRMEPLLARGMTGPSLIDIVHDGVKNRLWRQGDPELIRAVAERMRGETVLIADGHHRYETALAYRDLMRIKSGDRTGTAAFDYTMMFFSSMDDPGLVVFPTHRLVHSLDSADAGNLLERVRESFEVTQAASLEDLASMLSSQPEYAFGLIAPGGFHLLKLKGKELLRSLISADTSPEVRELDVTLLHSYLLEEMLGISREAQEKKMNLDYVKTVEEAGNAVAGGSAQFAFLMNPTKLTQIRRVARAGQTMPQKSTFFYPKLLSGLLLYPLE